MREVRALEKNGAGLEETRPRRYRVDRQRPAGTGMLRNRKACKENSGVRNPWTGRKGPYIKRSLGKKRGQNAEFVRGLEPFIYKVRTNASN